jgi:hypothetical protein
MNTFVFGGVVTADLTDVARLQRNLKAYLDAPHKRTVLELLSHKGNQMRIELWRQFWKHRFIKRKGDWRNTLKRIIGGGIGKGIKVRWQSLHSPWDSRVPVVDKNGKKLSLYQKLVAQEIMRRVSGSGVLGVSFLTKRWKKSKGAKPFLIENRTNTLGQSARFELRDDFVQITGFTPGLEKIALRYGILREVIRKANEDVEGYLADHFGPAFLTALHAK